MITIPLTIVDERSTRDVIVTLSSDQIGADAVYDALALTVPAHLDPEITAGQQFYAGALLSDTAAGLSDTAAGLSDTAAGLSDTAAGLSDTALDGAVLEVTVVAGLDAGHQTLLPAGTYGIAGGSRGRARWGLQVDGPARPPVPWHESGATIEILGNSGGSLAAGVPTDPEAGTAGVLRRPPISATPRLPDPVNPPVPIAPVPAPSPLSWAALLAPVPIAVLMAVFFRPLFALFAALGPVFALARWAEGRRTYRRGNRRRDAQVAAQLVRYAADQAAFAEQEAARRWACQPHVGALWGRARSRSVRVWERRGDTPGFLHVTVGVGPDRVVPDPGSEQFVDLRAVPWIVDLAGVAGLGLHGRRDAVIAAASSLILQLTTLQGPSDLTVELVCPADRVAVWDWLKWLPHVVDSPLGQSNGITSPADRVRVVIVDDPAADVHGRRRELEAAGHDVRVIAIADQATTLPAMCDALVHIAEHGELSDASSVEPRRMCPTGISPSTAASWARGLAAVQDPDAGSSTNTLVEPSLVDLIGFTGSPACRTAWQGRDPAAPLRATIGLAGTSPFVIDLDSDGPHALIGGTTGSGKSELLRTLVLGLASAAPPQHLHLVLFDFKGGGAFDVCADLPHVVGVVTDLDEQLVSRAIDSLRIELQRREEVLRGLQASDLSQAPQAFPRLVVVIDEFAVLSTEYPDLMRSLIDLAARGRSLGMHLVLATQRPSGVVDQKIRANTNLRIALRMQDPLDSHDLLGTGEAALLDRRHPGRAIVSIGGDRPVTIQVAHAAAPVRTMTGCQVEAFEFNGPKTGTSASFSPSQARVPDSGERDVADQLRQIDVVVAGLIEASQAWDKARPLWTMPLPSHIEWNDLEDLSQSTGWPSLGVTDVVATQEHCPWRWDPATSALVLYSASAHVASALLQTLATRFALAEGPDRIHLYVVDGGAQAVTAIAELPHTGALVGSHELDRVDRTLRLFEQALVERRMHSTSVNGHSAPDPDDVCGPPPTMVLLIDNIGAVLHAHGESERLVLVERLEALARDGRVLGLAVAITARSARDVPHRLGQHLGTRLVGELADPAGALMLGLRPRDLERVHDMQVLDPSTGNLIVIANPPDRAETPEVARPERPGYEPQRVPALPTVMSSADLPSPSWSGTTLRVPVGLSIGAVAPVSIDLDAGEHCLIVGPAGSGRSSVLSMIADQLCRLDDGLQIVGPEQASGELVRTLLTADRPTIALLDNAARLDDEGHDMLRQLIADAASTVRLFVATTPDHVRGIRSSVADLRGRGTGIILAGRASDGDLLRVPVSPIPGGTRIAGRAHVCVRGHGAGAHLAAPLTTHPSRP